MSKHFFKKTLATTLAVAALTGFGFLATDVNAAYQLSDEVTTATPALLEATEIGVRTYNTTDPVLAKAPNKDAIVVMSFGTTFTGIEYNYKTAVYNQYKHNFKKMTFGTPLMYWMGQEGQTDDIAKTVQAVATQFPKVGPKDAVLIMAHGTPDPSNAYYSVIQDRLESAGLHNTYIYTVEGWPSLEDIVPQLKAKGIEHVTLMPFMMVAGDHANNDMSGDEPDSHKSILLADGFKVDTYIHGLGENQKIRDLFAAHADEAWQALQNDAK